MSLPYISGDDRDDIERAKANGKTDDQIAGHYRISPDELRSLMGWKSSKPVPTNQDQDFDLWAADKLQEVL
jgi:hypothetical protein